MAPSGTHLDREVKLAMDPAADLPDLRAVAGRSVRQPDQLIDTAYFDTADLDLWNHGVTLRHRLGDGPDVGKWTVKVASGSDKASTGADGGRPADRLELEWIGRRHEIPDQAAKVLHGLIRRRPVEAVTTLSTTRSRFLLGEDEPWGELDNDVVSVVGGPADGSRFRRIEIDLVADRPPVADRVVRRLIDSGARPDGEPKLAKALGPSAGARRRKPQLGRKTSMAALVSDRMAAGLDSLLHYDVRIRVAGTDVEPADVHKARVAARRLRSELKLLGPVLDPVWVDHTRDGLRSLGRALGELRDLDIIRAGLDDEEAASAVRTDEAAVRDLIDTHRRAATTKLAAVLDGESYMDLIDRLHAAAALPPMYPVPGSAMAEVRAARILPRLVRAEMRRLDKQARRARRRPSDAALHRTRIKAKQLRYSAELAAPVVGRKARHTAAAAKELQTLLGMHHDVVTASVWLRRASETAPGPAAFAAGRLSVVQESRKSTLATQWVKAYRKTRAKKMRTWLT